MIDRFDKAIERFYERIITEEITLNEHDFIHFYDDIISFNDKFGEDILNKFILDEANEHVNYKQPVLDLFMNARFCEQITYNRILEKLNPSWMYYEDFYNCERRSPCYVFQIDFLNPVKAYDMFKFLSLTYAKEIGKEKIIEEFKENVKLTTSGLIKDLNDSFIIIFDENKLNKKLISHELTHYFQKMIGNNLFEDKTEIKNSLKKLQLSNEQLNYFFSNEEFYPNVYVNMIEDFKKFYFLKYKNVSKEQFINYVISQIEEYKDKIFESSFGITYVNAMNTSSSLQMLAASYTLNVGYDKIVSILKRDFKDPIK